jgi:hypothetical protein
MLLTEMFIKEQSEDAAIIFGRFNPAHQGHVAAWKEAAKFPIWYVGTNQSTIGPKDPLPFDVKIKVMETLMPELKGHLVAETTWFTLASMVYKKHGAVTLHIVTDETDSATYVKMLKGQNGKEGKHGFYQFADIVWQPAPRLSSATDLRAAVAANDPTAFYKAAGVPADTTIDGKPFFDLVKYYLDAQAKPVKEHIEKVGSKYRLVSKKSGKNLGTYDTKEEAKKRERQVQYFKHVNETGGVGVVANNARQAKDPRYSTSITADIKPGETQRQAKKMGFSLDKKGLPPLVHSTAAKNTTPNKAYNLGLTESKSFKLKK